MIDLFEYNHYRDYLHALIKSREIKGLKQVALARAMGCQAAYLSQVLKDRAELTEDQGVKLGFFLSFTEMEMEYFLVILRLARAGTPELRTYLEKSRQKILEMRREVDHRIHSKKTKSVSEATLYYCSSWLPALIHAGTSCDQYQTAAALAERFRLEKSEVESHLHLLEKHGLVEFKNGKWRFLGGSIHFSKNSALDQSFQTQRRLHAMNSLSHRRAEDIHYAMVFPVNSRTAKKIREVLLSTIEEIHRQAEPSPSEDVYALCFDFYLA